MIKYKSKYNVEDFNKIIESEFELITHAGPISLIHCMIKRNKHGYFLVDVSQKPPTFYQLRLEDFNNLIGLNLAWEKEKCDYDDVDIPYGVMQDIINRWGKAV